MKCGEILELRYKCKEEQSLEGKELRNTIVITFAFQVVFTAFNALQNMHSSLHDEESLGNISLAIISATAIVSSVLSPTIIGLIGTKPAIVAFFAAHCLYVLANFYPSFATMAPAAFALGAFNGPAWTSQALYISASAFSFSKSSSASPYSILSRFNGFFFAVFATSQILGNLVTSTVIKDGVNNQTYSDGFKYCGTDDCPATENATAIEDPEGWVVDIILGIFMSCTLLGLFMVVFLLSPLPRSEWIQRVSVHKSTTSCFNVLVSTNMILLAPFILFTSIEQGFLLSSYTKSYVACPLGIHMVGYVMASYGATTPVFVFIVSRLAKVAGRFILLTLSMTVQIVLFIILFLWSPTSDDELFIFLIPMVWGVSESVLLAQANSLIAMQFPDQKEPAFANFHACRSLGYTISFLNASYMCVSTKLIVCLAFAGVGLVLYVFVEFKTKVKEKRALEQPRKSSLASVESQVEMRPARRAASVSSKRTSVSSLHSVQDRLSFDRVELTDIIKEAQQGWRRDEDGLTLEINKVMSQEHLSNSIVTSWYRTAQESGDFIDRIMPRPITNRPGLPRSLSDGHLHLAALKVDAKLVKIRHGRSNTIATRARKQMQAAALPKRRHVSDINPPNLDVIREIAYEEDELEGENETENEFYNVDLKDENDNVFAYKDDDQDHDEDNDEDDDIDEEEAKRIRDYQNILRRLSATLNKDNLAANDNPEEEDVNDDDSLSNLSGSSAEPETMDNESSLEVEGGRIKFTIGTSSPYSSVRYNNAYESDDNETVHDYKNTTYNPRRPRLYSDSMSDVDYYNANSSVVNSTDNSKKAKDTLELPPSKQKKAKDTLELPPSKQKKAKDTLELPPSKQKKAKDTLELPPSKQKKAKARGVFKSLTRSIQLNNKAENKSNNISSNKPVGPDNEENDHSDADSDGFVNDNYDDNENYIASDGTDYMKVKSKKRIPVSESEDINSIY